MGEPRAAAARRRPRKCGGGGGGGSGSYPWCCLQPHAAPRSRGLYGSAARRLAAAGEDSLRRQRLADAAFGPSRFPSTIKNEVTSVSAQGTLSRGTKSLTITVSFPCIALSHL